MLRRCLPRYAKDPFKVLGLTRSASKAQVKSKFRELAKQFHPDAASGSTVKMEEINRAYNLLLKEGAYERLHLSGNPRPATGAPAAPSGGATAADATGYARRRTAPFARTENVGEAEDYSKVSALDADTERVTPEGTFMYQNRDSGEWITLEKPLVRANQTRYRSYAQCPLASAGLQEDLRRRRDEQERVQNAKTAFDRAVDSLNDGSHLPSKNRYVLFGCAIVWCITMHFTYKKSVAFCGHKLERHQFYRELDVQRAKDDEMYAAHKIEVETLVAAAALILLAAAKKKHLEDPVVGQLHRDDEYYSSIRPPKAHFEVVSGN